MPVIRKLSLLTVLTVLLSAAPAAADITPSRDAGTVAGAFTELLPGGAFTGAAFTEIPPEPGATAECSNLTDDDGDGFTDALDPGCETGALDNREEDDPAPECSNGFDDDGNLLADFPDDPGCDSASDNLEFEGEPNPDPGCSNGFDDDGDGTTDFTPPVGETADPGCASAADIDEGSEGLPLGEDPDPVAVSTTALTGFPTSSTSYAILTTGNSEFADDPNDSPGTGQGNGGGSGTPSHGDNVFDLVTLRVDVNVPAGRNCLRVDFRFLSDEFPEFVGSTVNDAFVAELDTSNFTINPDASVNAPNNFAYDSAGNLVSINTAAFSETEAAGTTYDGATPRLRASTPITPGAHSIYFSVFDQGDDILDSAAFLDALRLDTAPADACTQGATPDLTPPAVALAAPADGGITTDPTPAYSGTAGNAAGDSNTVTVKVYAGADTTGTLLQTLTATRSGTAWSVNGSPALAPGTYTAQAEQSDSAGNVGVSGENTFEVAVDDTDPVVTLTTPADGSTTADTTPAYGGTAGNVAGDSSTVGVNVYSGSTATGTPVQTLTATRSGTAWSVNGSPALADGTYTVQAEQSDEAGNTGSSAEHTFTIDADPLVTLSTPANDSSTADAAPTYSGSAGTAPGDSNTVTVKVYSGSAAAGTPVQTLTATRSGGSWSVDGSTALPDGTYTARAEQSDGAANTGFSGTRTFTVDTAVPAGVTLTGPAAGSSTTDTTPTFSGAAGSAPGDGGTVTLRIYSGSSASGAPVRTMSVPRSGGGWSIDVAPALDPGTYTAQVEQVDAAGNRTLTGPLTFTIAGGGGGGQPLPPPVAGTSFNVEPVSGVVTFKCGKQPARPLQEAEQLPVGCRIDARRGKVRITTDAGNGKTHSAVFHGGVFKVLQKAGRRPVTELRLVGALENCPRGRRSSAARGTRGFAAAKRGRRLWGDGKGRFRTRGRRSAATVTGTKWLVEDRCDTSTLTKVTQGKVQVRDFARRKTINLKRGQTYIARPPGRRRP
jgi:Bacterial Ig-like domain